MPNPVQTVADLVASKGEKADRATTIAEYIADRCAGLSLASVHSSGHASLHRDTFLRQSLGLSNRQVSAWLGLLRGTRPVYRLGRVVGGLPGLAECLVAGSVDEEAMRRFDRLATVAATGQLVRQQCAATRRSSAYLQR